MFTSPGDIAFSFLGIQIYYYGIIMAISLTVGVFVSNLITKRFYIELNSDVIYDIAPHIIIGAIIGARLYYCLLSINYYIASPLEILQVWHGGLSIHGAIIGGLIGGIIYSRRHQLPILKLCDIFSFGLSIGQAIGRWGNFFNSEAFGKPTESLLKLYIPIYKRPLEYMQYDYFHPTFLYESIFDIIIFLLLLIVIKKTTKKIDGTIFFTYLIMYSLLRLITEQLRIDSILNLWGIPIAQIVSAVIILISTLSLVFIFKNNASKGS